MHLNFLKLPEENSFDKQERVSTQRNIATVSKSAHENKLILPQSITFRFQAEIRKQESNKWWLSVSSKVERERERKRNL